MKYDTPIMHHIKSVADMPKKKRFSIFSAADLLQFLPNETSTGDVI